MAHKYRGRDRRILEKLRACIRLAQDRDLLALSGVKSAKISTRSLMFDPDSEPLYTQLVGVRGRVDALLAETV